VHAWIKKDSSRLSAWATTVGWKRGVHPWIKNIYLCCHHRRVCLDKKEFISVVTSGTIYIYTYTLFIIKTERSNQSTNQIAHWASSTHTIVPVLQWLSYFAIVTQPFLDFIIRYSNSTIFCYSDSVIFLISPIILLQTVTTLGVLDRNSEQKPITEGFSHHEEINILNWK
jgi:hypothetical protein